MRRTLGFNLVEVGLWIAPDDSIAALLGSGAGAAGLGETEALVAEDLVHVLQTAAGRLGVPEPGDGDEGGVEHGPDDVQPVLQVGDGVGGDEDDDEVAQPVGSDA